MEYMLKKYFDYQRFEQNARLKKLILETENRFAKELSDDDLTMVAAAGEPSADSLTVSAMRQNEDGGKKAGGN